MAVTQFRAPENTVAQSLGGTLAADVAIEDLSTWVEAIEPWETPLYTLFNSSDEVEQDPHRWGQSFRIDTQTFQSGATSIGATSTTVDDGDIFQVGMVLDIADPMSGTTDVQDLTAVSQVVVTGVNGNVLTHTATTNNHGDDAIVRIVGTAEEMNSFHTEAPRQRGTRLFNYIQRFQAQLTSDIRAQNMPTWEHRSNPLLADFAEEMKKQKLFLERAIYSGVRTQENTTNGVAGRFGGLRTFITTNAVNMTGSVLDLESFEDVLFDLWTTADSRAAGKIVMSMNTARIFDELIDVQRRLSPTDDEIAKGIRKYQLRTGTYELIETRECPESEIWILNPDDIKLRPFKGANWHVTEKAGKDHAVDHDVKAISGDFTLEVRNEKAMARIYNFDTRLSQYAS